MMQPLYHTSATSEGGRNGRANLAEGGIGLAMALPKSMGGSGKGANPEQLFALGYSACFNQAVLVVGGQHKVDVQRAEVTVDVGLGKTDAGGFGLSVAIKLRLPGVDAGKAREILDAAHLICPYSNATRGNIPVTLELI
jgi:osmotically inducible protein OsmC